MSSAATSYAPVTYQSVVPIQGAWYIPRPKWLPVLPAVATLIAGISWVVGGIIALNDLAWVLMIGACVAYTILEFKVFPYRMGVSGLVIFAGVIGWFGVDYMRTWSGIFGFGNMSNLIDSPVTRGGVDLSVVAKTSYYHMLFITCMIIGLLLPGGAWLSKLIASTPQPARNSTLFALIVGLFLFGLIPYFIWTAEPPHIAIFKRMTAMRTGQGAIWTVGRSGGNLNTSWGAYISQWMDIACFAGLIASFYAIYLAREASTKFICWMMWLYTLGIAFGTGTRGEVVYVCAPVAAMLFIKYQTTMSHWVQANRMKAWTLALLVAVGMYPLIQIQGLFRNVGVSGLSISKIELDPRDNTMFSHSLFVFQHIPHDPKIPGSRDPFFTNLFPGQGAIVAIPQSVFFFAIGPIPRALWNDKPWNPALEWGSVSRSGARDFAQSTGISTGLVGNWYALCGVFGVIEGGLFWGWLLGVFDRTLWLARWKPLVLIIVLGLQVTMFRTFRDPDYNLFYPLLIGVVALWAVSLMIPKSSPAR